MAEPTARQARIYDTSLDRLGLAIGVGGLLIGLLTVILVLMAGQREMLSLAGALILGMIFGMIGVTAAGGPIWLVLHLSGRRGPLPAALLGLFASLMVFVAGQTYGLGLFDMPATDSRTLSFRWMSAIATSVLPALISAGIALAMWRVAYRRIA